MKNRNFIAFIAAFTLFAGCAPVRVQSGWVVDYKDGKPIYMVTGYTGPGEIESGSSKSYIEYALAKNCPDGIKIIFMREQETHNAFSKFLYWEAKAECN